MAPRAGQADPLISRPGMHPLDSDARAGARGFGSRPLGDPSGSDTNECGPGPRSSARAADGLSAMAVIPVRVDARAGDGQGDRAVDMTGKDTSKASGRKREARPLAQAGRR